VLLIICRAFDRIYPLIYPLFQMRKVYVRQMNVKHVTEYLYIPRIASHVGSPILSFNLDDPHRSLPADIGRCQEFDGASFLGGTLLALEEASRNL